MAFVERNHVEDVSSSLRQITRLPSVIPGVEMIDPPSLPHVMPGEGPASTPCLTKKLPLKHLTYPTTIMCRRKPTSGPSADQGAQSANRGRKSC